MIKNKKGITLIALIVTIIVLIVLAGVSINLVVGNNGIITKAKEAKENFQLASEEEERQLNELFDEMISKINPNQLGNKITFYVIGMNDSQQTEYETYENTTWKQYIDNGGQYGVKASEIQGYTGGYLEYYKEEDYGCGDIYTCTWILCSDDGSAQEQVDENSIIQNGYTYQWVFEDWGGE